MQAGSELSRLLQPYPTVSLLLWESCSHNPSQPPNIHTSTERSNHALPRAIGRVKGTPYGYKSEDEATLTSRSQERITRILDLSRVAIHYGYLPLIIYLGYTQSNPRPTLVR